MTDLKELTKKEILLLMLSLAVLVITIFQPVEPFVINSAAEISGAQSGNLIAVLHAKTNSYFQLTTLGALLSGRLGCSILLICGLLGMTATFGIYRIPPTQALAISGILYGSLIALSGYDFVVIGPLASLPLIYLIICSSNAAKLSYLVLLSTAIFILWLLLFALALPTLFLAIALYFLIEQRKIEPLTAMTLSMGAVMLFLLTALSPALEWPDYPALARVSTLIDGPPWIARPLIGHDLPFHTIDRAAVVSLNAPLLLPLAAILLTVGFLVRNNPLAKRAWLSCAALFVVAFFDLRLTEETAQIAPLQSISRLLPDLSLIALSPIAISLVVAGLILICSLSFISSTLGICLGLLITATTLLINEHSGDPLSKSNTRLPSQWVSSPSRPVVSFFTPEVLQTAAAPWHSIRPSSSSFQLNSSNPNKSDSHLILDRDKKSRWSAGNGMQKGTEWLSFEFFNPQKIIGVELQTGNFPTDFPRGLTVKAGPSCDSAALETISRNENWQGNPEFTSEGFPYFSAQSSVKVFFAKEIEVACLRIEQTAKNEAFDWSIAEFRLIKKGPGNN